MKKTLVLFAMLLICSATTLFAQQNGGGGGQGGDPAARAAAMKQRYKDMGLNDVQVDSVVAINADMRPKMMAIRDASEADRPALMKAMSDERNTRLEKALPADLAKKVIEAMSMQRGPRGGGGGGGRN
jgi:hypothetical protein